MVLQRLSVGSGKAGQSAGRPVRGQLARPGRPLRHNFTSPKIDALYVADQGSVRLLVPGAHEVVTAPHSFARAFRGEAWTKTNDELVHERHSTGAWQWPGQQEA